MVETVAQVGARLRHDEGHFRPHHRQHSLALSPFDAVERDKGTPCAVDVVERVLRRMTKRFVLKFLEVGRQLLDQWELAVDNEIDQRIDQVVHSKRTQPRTCRLQPVAHRLEDVRLVIVERDHIVLAEEDADLPRMQLTVLVGGIAEHDEALPLVEVELAPLVGVEDVLERQGMQVEGHAEVAQHLRARPPRDVDPGVAGRAEMEAALVDLHALHHLDIVRRVLDQGEVERLVGDRRTAGQGARRGAGLGVAVKKAVHHSLSPIRPHRPS